jgi:hypothetical protein
MAAENLVARVKKSSMTKTDLADFAQEWIAAWNAHDLERILEHYADDAELVSPFVANLTGSDGSVRGKAALRDYFARGLKAFPTLHFELVRIYSGVRSCVLEYRSVNGLRTAELMEFDEQGKVRRVLAHYSDEADGGSFPKAM